MANLRVLSIFDSGIIGGPGRGLFQIIRHCQRTSCNFIVANFKYKNPKSTEFIDAIRKQGFPLNLFTQRFRFDPLPLFEICRVVKEEQINIIETHSYKGHILGWYASVFCGVKWVAWAHGWTTEDIKVRIFHSLDMLTLRFADVAVAVSHPLFESLDRLRGKKRRTELILNAVDVDVIPGASDRNTIRSSYNISKDCKLIAVIGRLSSEKGQRFLFEALKLLKSKKHNIKLIAVGDGPDRASLERWVNDNGLSTEIIFAGHQNEIMQFYSAIDLLVIPSLSEGLPNVLLEAMALGVPVVSTNVGEIPEIIVDRINGLIVPKANAEALAAAIETALTSEQLRESLIAAAKKLVDSKFSPKKRADQVVALYHELTHE